MISRLFVLSLILFCLELGVFLVVLPWSGVWERNYFLFRYPTLGPWVLNYYLRGAISGLGLVDIGLGVWTAAHFHETVERFLEPSSPSPRPPRGESFTRGQIA